MSTGLLPFTASVKELTEENARLRNVYSLVETAKANDVEPFAYLSLVLDEIRWLGKAPPAAELDALLPWNPALQKKLEN